MPIITGGVAPPPVEPPPAVVIPEIGYASITYFDPDGNAWPMTGVDEGRGYWALADGVAGLGAAPLALTTDPYPRGGVRLRHVQPQARIITWPVHVRGDSHQEFWERWHALGEAFVSTARRRVPGVLEVARPNGQRRQIEVVYQEGWEGLGQFGTGINWDNAVVSLLCQDPFWTDPTPITERRESSTGVAFLANFFQLSSGRVLGATTLTNPGAEIAYPVWTITGPASLVTFTNTTTGQSFALNPNNLAPTPHGNLTAGQQVTIRTDPIQVRYQTGANWTSALNWPAAEIWGLEPGLNEVTFQLDGSGAGSAVDVAYNPRYSMP